MIQVSCFPTLLAIAMPSIGSPSNMWSLLRLLYKGGREDGMHSLQLNMETVYQTEAISNIVVTF